jgi:hypothetical protein
MDWAVALVGSVRHGATKSANAATSRIARSLRRFDENAIGFG